MAKFKKTSKKSGAGANKAQAKAEAERLSKSLSESAQQIWLAGVGAFGRAQAEGTRLFEGLVKEGVSLENTARKFAGHRADVVRDAVGSSVGQARERAADTWDRLEKVFEARVHKALVALGVPDRDDLRDLSNRVDTLTAELRRQRGAAAGKAGAARKAPAGRARPARATTAAKPAGKAAKKTARKAAKKTRG